MFVGECSLCCRELVGKNVRYANSLILALTLFVYQDKGPSFPRQNVLNLYSLQLGVLELHYVRARICSWILKVECGSVFPPLACPPGPVLSHLFGLFLAAAVAVPPSLQPSHQAGQQQAGSQDAENPSKAVQLERAAIGVGTCMAVKVTAAGARPPLLF